MTPLTYKYKYWFSTYINSIQYNFSFQCYPCLIGLLLDGFLSSITVLVFLSLLLACAQNRRGKEIICNCKQSPKNISFHRMLLPTLSKKTERNHIHKTSLSNTKLLYQQVYECAWPIVGYYKEIYNCLTQLDIAETIIQKSLIENMWVKVD